MVFSSVAHARALVEGVPFDVRYRLVIAHAPVARKFYLVACCIYLKRQKAGLYIIFACRASIAAAVETCEMHFILVLASTNSNICCVLALGF